MVVECRKASNAPAPLGVIDGDTIVIADQLVRLHGIDAPELDQTSWWRGQQIACGTMSLAALEALIAGVKVRCKAVERDRLVATAFVPNGVDIGRRLVSAGCGLAVLDRLCRRPGRGPNGQAWDTVGHLIKPWEWRASSPWPTQASLPSAPARRNRSRLDRDLCNRLHIGAGRRPCVRYVSGAR